MASIFTEFAEAFPEVFEECAEADITVVEDPTSPFGLRGARDDFVMMGEKGGDRK